MRDSRIVGIALLSAFVLSSCAVAPGMHMNASKLTPVKNSDGEIQAQRIIPVDANLIVAQDRLRAQKAEESAKNYVPPEGFFTNLSEYQYHVGAGDQVEVSIFYHDKINLSGALNNNNANKKMYFHVNNKGYIYYPFVGEIYVSGKTVEQIRDLLTQKLAVELIDPQVDVEVKKYNSKRVSVVGSVLKPMTIPLTDTPLSVLEAVGQAQPTQCSSETQLCADLEHVELKQAGQKVLVNLKTLQSDDGSSSNWILSDRAVINVADNSFYQVFVLGGVNSPGQYRMIGNKMSLKEAIGRSKGPTNLSDPGYTYIVRDFRQSPKIYSINLRSPDAFNLADRFLLMPQDVVFVSTSKLQTFNEVLNQLMPSLTTIALVKSISD